MSSQMHSQMRAFHGSSGLEGGPQAHSPSNSSLIDQLFDLGQEGPTTHSSGSTPLLDAIHQANGNPVFPAHLGDPWSDASMAARIDYKDHLAGKKDTQAMMRDLANTDNSPEAEQARQDALHKLAVSRGVTDEEMQAQFTTFQEKRAEANRIRKEKGLDPIPDLNESAEDGHPDHMGSIQQLRAGSYAGQAFGIDPVFGALLNPTAGLVGPGNDSYAADPDSVASYHGEAHDAFGYLKSYHDYGPGYRYGTADENGPEAPAGDFLTGQASGFRKWNELLATKGKADPKHPGDVDAQMQDSLKELAGLNPDERPAGMPAWEPVGMPPEDLPWSKVGDVAEWLLTRQPEHGLV